MDTKELIIHIRAKLDLTQEELAKLLNVSYQTIYRWEMGKTKPTRKTMCQIAEICKENNIKVEADK